MLHFYQKCLVMLVQIKILSQCLTYFVAGARMSLGGEEKDCLARLRPGLGKRAGREAWALARGGKEK